MSEEVMYADLKFQDASKTENGKSGIKAPATPPHAWQCRVVALALLCLLLLAGLGILGSMFYVTSNMQMGKLNELQSFKEELQRNLSLQIIENLNSSVKNRDLSIKLQKMATKLCHQLYEKHTEHKCKPCPKMWLWHEDSCYLLSQRSEDWQTSGQECRNLNASLLKIKNKSVLDFIKSQTSTHLWLGLSPRKDKGSSKLLEEIISSSDWLINNTDGFRGRMYCGYRYRDYLEYKLCTSREYFICEKLANQVKIENTLINEELDGLI